MQRKATMKNKREARPKKLERSTKKEKMYNNERRERNKINFFG